MLLFVYGSLRNGFHNNNLLKDSKCISKAETVEKYYMVGRLNHELDPFEDGRFPYPPRKFLYPYAFCDKLRQDLKANNIQGELYEVSETRLEELDKHEGHPTVYKRISVLVCLQNEVQVESSMYLLESASIKLEIINNPQLLVQVNGDWSNATFS
jgi:gamma-glutamylcyclotransferase (GGCT)/AIG2-like uncharacterized protein YtfP